MPNKKIYLTCSAVCPATSDCNQKPLSNDRWSSLTRHWRNKHSDLPISVLKVYRQKMLGKDVCMEAITVESLVEKLRIQESEINRLEEENKVLLEEKKRFKEFKKEVTKYKNKIKRFMPEIERREQAELKYKELKLSEGHKTIVDSIRKKYIKNKNSKTIVWDRFQKHIYREIYKSTKKELAKANCKIIAKIISDEFQPLK